MTQEQILNGKILCCNFMGLKPVLGSDGKYSWKDGVFFMTRCETFNEAMGDIFWYAKYDSDWNWLMGVVKKIRESFQQYPDLSVSSEWKVLKNIIPSADIDITFQVVVEFIQFYNDNSSK